MNRKLDTNRLFLAQVSAHVEELSNLLALGPQDSIDEMIDRVLLSTTMLGSSASLMELAEWEAFLKEFERLLLLYKEKNLPWDERIAQMSAELIEREEEIVSEWTDQTTSIRKLFVPDQWEVLSLELREVLAMADDAAARPDNWQESEPPAPEVAHEVAEEAPIEATPEAADTAAEEVPTAAPEAAEAAEAPAAEPIDETPAEEPVADDRPLTRSMMALQERVQTMLGSWHRASWNLDDATPEDLESLRRDLHLIDFYARTVERTLGTKSAANRSAVMTSLDPVQSAIADYASVLCGGTNRRIDVTFLGESIALDARLLLPVQRVVQLMIGDIYLRCDDEYLRVEIHVAEQDGSLLWSVRDNGSNFMTDSPIDPGEYLAFYPGLRETSRVLQRLRSLLWVEPDEDQETRFAFTIPDSLDGGKFVVWGGETDQFAVPASQVSTILPLTTVGIENDTRGEFVVHKGRRIPLVRLGQLYSGGPVDGDSVAVIGCLEKRIAFYIDGSGRIEIGEWLRNAVPLWGGMHPGAAEIDATKLPLLEANGLIEHYLKMVNDPHSEGLSGGVAGDEHDLSQRQAQMVKDAAAPPESVAPVDGSAQVLIVERSAALRQELSAILGHHQVASKVVERLDDAIDWLNSSNPSLIVSEFRVPSMAAKTLAERVQGREIPILVTTSHEGHDADLLVSKLGVAGYISKPFEPAEVWTRIEAHLGGTVGVGPR